MKAALREQVVSWFDALPDDAPFGHGLFVGVATEPDLHDLWNEQLRHFLRRGEIVVYPSAGAVEAGFVWRDPKYNRNTVASQIPDEPADTAPDEPATGAKAAG